jgi:hypothetical protein
MLYMADLYMEFSYSCSSWSGPHMKIFRRSSDVTWADTIALKEGQEQGEEERLGGTAMQV